MLAEFPGLLMKMSDSMASCSLTFWWGEKRMGSMSGVLPSLWFGVTLRFCCPGVCGDALWECERRVGV